MMKMLKSEAGFTLIEIVFVVIILAILGGVALVSFGGLDTQAKDSRVVADFRTLATALKAYKALTSAFPAALNDLLTASGSYEPVLDEVPIDPYTNAAYGYTNPNGLDPDAVDITSGSATYASKTIK